MATAAGLAGTGRGVPGVDRVAVIPDGAPGVADGVVDGDAGVGAGGAVAWDCAVDGGAAAGAPVVAGTAGIGDPTPTAASGVDVDAAADGPGGPGVAAGVPVAAISIDSHVEDPPTSTVPGPMSQGVSASAGNPCARVESGWLPDDKADAFVRSTRPSRPAHVCHSAATPGRPPAVPPLAVGRETTAGAERPPPT